MGTSVRGLSTHTHTHTHTPGAQKAAKTEGSYKPRFLESPFCWAMAELSCLLNPAVLCSQSALPCSENLRLEDRVAARDMKTIETQKVKSKQPTRRQPRECRTLVFMWSSGPYTRPQGVSAGLGSVACTALPQSPEGFQHPSCPVPVFFFDSMFVKFRVKAWALVVSEATFRAGEVGREDIPAHLLAKFGPPLKAPRQQLGVR